MKGRPPIPAETKRATGNRGKRKIPEPVAVSQRVVADEAGATAAQLEVIDAQLPAPPHLAGDDEALGLWRYYGELLARAGVLEVSDQLALQALVEAEVLERRSYRALDAERQRQQRRLAQLQARADDGDEHAAAALERTSDLHGEGVIVNGTTAIVTHPAFRTWRDAAAVKLRHLEHLGLTPVARTRLGVLGLAGHRLQQQIEAHLPPNPTRRGRA